MAISIQWTALRNWRSWGASAVFLLLFQVASDAAEERDLTVFAAASLYEALTQIGQAYEADCGCDVTFSFAASSVLARQIQAGAPVDVFASASTDWMTALEASGDVVAEDRIDLASNRLVLVAREPVASFGEIGPDDDLSTRIGKGRLAVALTSAVPAGIYAEYALTTLGHWDALKPRLAETDNVRAALSLVATGAAAFGIVYASDAAAEPRVTLIGTFPGDSHPDIRYPAAPVSTGKTHAASKFLDFLQTDTAREVFLAQGFLPPPE